MVKSVYIGIFPSVLKTNSLIYKNILKYGHNSFSVSILEVLGETNSVSKSHILENSFI